MSYDKLIFEISKKGRRGHDLNIETNNLANLPQQLLRSACI